MDSSQFSPRPNKPKLKFGIDRLLSSDNNSNEKEVHHQIFGLAKPQPTVAVPCSECVTSLFRCCTLNNGETVQHHHEHSFLQHHLHQSQDYTPIVSSGNIFTVQPIRPFVTRPGKALWKFAKRHVEEFLAMTCLSSMTNLILWLI